MQFFSNFLQRIFFFEEFNFTAYTESEACQADQNSQLSALNELVRACVYLFLATGASAPHAHFSAQILQNTNKTIANRNKDTEKSINLGFSSHTRHLDTIQTSKLGKQVTVS